MLGGYEKVYYYHLKKCGGTTLNSWLSLLVRDSDVWSPLWDKEIVPELMGQEDRRQYESASSVSSFLGNVIYDHAPLALHIKQSAYRFTLLRSPAPRLLSQIKDWRRLDAIQIKSVDPALADVIHAVQTQTINQFLKGFANAPAGALLDNYQVKAIAAARLGLTAYQVSDSQRLLDIALEVLNESFDFVGLAEQQDECRNIIARALKVPPMTQLVSLNTTVAVSVSDADVANAEELIERCTKLDSVLYKEAERLFNGHVGREPRYGSHAFELFHAHEALGKMTGSRRDGGVAFSVRDPLYAQGVHGRDAANTQHCAVWAGPGTTTQLYMPILPGVSVEFLLWIRGYADESVINGLKIFLDGQEVNYARASAAGAAELLIAKFEPERSFVRIDIYVDRAFSDVGADERMRSFCFDAYGWRVV